MENKKILKFFSGISGFQREIHPEGLLKSL
jgi:hypothetical protein